MNDIIFAALCVLLMGLLLANLDFSSHRLIGRQRWVGTALALVGIGGLLLMVVLHAINK